MDSLWPRSQKKFADLRDFLATLSASGELRQIDVPVSAKLELTEVSRRVLGHGLWKCSEMMSICWLPNLSHSGPTISRTRIVTITAAMLMLAS